MAIKKSELYSSLWKSCDELRGGMDASQYKDYVLVSEAESIAMNNRELLGEVGLQDIDRKLIAEISNFSNKAGQNIGSNGDIIQTLKYLSSALSFYSHFFLEGKIAKVPEAIDRLSETHGKKLVEQLKNHVKNLSTTEKMDFRELLNEGVGIFGKNLREELIKESRK